MYLLPEIVEINVVFLLFKKLHYVKSTVLVDVIRD